MRIKQVLSPVDGLFSNMPQDIWGDDLDPTILDIELLTRIGGLDVAPVAEYYLGDDDILDVEGLSALLYQRFSSNWKRIWEAVRVEYNLMLTSTLDERRETTREGDTTEERDLLDVDEERRDLTTETDVDRSGTSDLTKSGSERHKVDDSLERDLTMTDEGTVKDEGKGSDTGTVKTEGDSARKGTGTAVEGVQNNGLGGPGVRPTSTTTRTETPNFVDENDTLETRGLASTDSNTRTDDLTKTDSGTETKVIDDVLSFTDRKDSTVDGGTEGTTATEGGRIDTQSKKTGIVGTLDDETTVEVFHSEGSSPLRTYQALITEELAGRSGDAWNFTDLVIRDVQSVIALMIWRRRRCV